MKKYVYLFVFVAVFIAVSCDDASVISPGFSDEYSAFTDVDAKWLVGITAPSNSEGQDGDLYLNSETGEIYLKVNNGWSSVTNITGPAGADGADGLPGIDGADGLPGIDGADGLPGIDGIGMTYWVHTITASESTFDGTKYTIAIVSPFFELMSCYDMWQLGTGVMLDLDQIWLDSIGLLLFTLGVGDGACIFYAPDSMIGATLVFFGVSASAF